MEFFKERLNTGVPENLNFNPTRKDRRKSMIQMVVLITVLLAVILGGIGLHQALPASAHSTSGRHNIIYLENQKPGSTKWQSRDLLASIRKARQSPPKNDDAPSDSGSVKTADSVWTDTSIRGYAGATSINHGDSINFYVGTTLPSYSIQIFRMGWYGGTGSTLVQTISNLTGQNQPIPAADPNTSLLQLNWNVSYTLQTTTSWVTGVYLAELIGSDGSTQYIPFVIRDDSSTADILYVLPVNTYQAYNDWGGKSLYEFNSTNSTRAYQVSFDRPYAGDDGGGGFFTGDYNMIRFLEKNSYNIAYATSVDLQTNPNLLSGHKVFLSNYHDEYWSMTMRTNLQNALNQGKNAAFFDADSIYWQIRFDNSSSGVANRVITCYKDVTLDPMSQTNPSLTTTLFRNAPVNMPENALLGEMYGSMFNWGVTSPWVVTNANHWIYNGTGLNNGDSIPGVVGYEFEQITNNGLTPSGLVALSNSPVTDIYGNNMTANGTIYTTGAGGLVFDAGTVYWEWKLDDNTINAYGADPRIQQMTINVLNAMINGAPVSTPTPTPTPTQTPTPTPTPSPTPAPTATYQSDILSDNPLAYWRLGESSGATQAVDTSGHGYTATYSGGITFGAPGAIANDTNTAISSAGTGKVASPAFSTVTNFTIEGWTYLTDPTWNSGANYNNALYGKYGNLRLLIRPGASNTSAYALGYFGVWLNGTEYSIQPVNKTLTNTNQWVHWVLVRNGSTLTAYRNGVQVGQRTDLPATATANITGSVLVTDTAYYLKGSVDEVALYNYALSATRIQAHYNCGLGSC